jgi:hypothetical protein
MKMFKERTQIMSAVNDERRQVLPSKVIWDGTINRFEVFRNNVEGHYGQIGAGHFLYSSFQEANLERGVDFYTDFLDEVPLGLSLQLHTIRFCNLPCNNFVQNVLPQMIKLFVTTFKDLFVSRVPKNPIVIPQAFHQALGT